ncbi:MAG: chorismate synthase [Candidatus Aminicenantales bacterium]
MLRFITAGESHGKALVGIVEGMVAGVRITEEEINEELRLRKRVWGRGPRAAIEEDVCEILSGVAGGTTIGSPISLMIKNREREAKPLTIPRPGHADLAGAIKHNFPHFHLVAERASARETAMRVAVGKVAKKFLSEWGIDFFSHTVMIGGIKSNVKLENFNEATKKARKKSALYSMDEKGEARMKEKIRAAKKKGDTLGGMCEILVRGVPPGLGSYTHYDRRLDCRLAGSLMSIPSVKAVEIGDGISASGMYGSQFHDALYFEKRAKRLTNRAGGIEGGVSNGETISLRLYVKPLPTLKKGLPSFELKTKKRAKAPYVRSDICVVPSVGIIGEAVAAWEICCLFMEKFGGDSVDEVKRNFNSYMENVRKF